MNSLTHPTKKAWCHMCKKEVVVSVEAGKEVECITPPQAQYVSHPSAKLLNKNQTTHVTLYLPMYSM